MKKIIVLIILLTGAFLVAAQDEPCKPKSFSITVGVGVRNFAESDFKDVYKDTPIIYSVDLALRVMRSLEVFLHSDYLSTEGEMTYTQETTTLKIIPLELGARFLLSPKNSCNPKFLPYLGAGLGYYMVKEEFEAGVPVETVDEKRIGFFGEGGLRFYLVKSIFIDAKLKYVVLTSEDDTRLSGITYMGGIGFSF